MIFIKQAIQIRTIGHRQKRNFVCNTERKDNFEEKKLKRIARRITAFAVVVAMATTFTVPAEFGDGFFGGFGNAIVASAAGPSGTCGTNLTWTIDGTTLTISGTGEMDNWDGFLGIPWVDYRDSIKSVVIENGVTSIGKCAFLDCSSLTSITIPDSVTSIGVDAFYNCFSLESIFLPNTLDVSSVSDFDKATQIRYTVTDNKVTITGVTLGSGQTSVTIPDTIGGKNVTVVYIQEGTTGIDVPASATHIKYSVNGAGNITIGEVTLGSGQTSVEIPKTIDGRTVTSIGDHAFKSCTSLKSIFLPDTLDVSVAEITETATQIKYTVTDNKVTIKKVTLGNGQTSVTIPETIDDKAVTSIGEYAFFKCQSLTSITIPNSVTSIGNSAFESCSSLTSITIPDGVTSIGERAFISCVKLATVSFGNNSRLSSIEGYVFANCNELTSITIPSSVTSIGNLAFYECKKLTSITIPSSVTSIGIKAFESCSSLTSITIQNGVNSIGDYAFKECSSLTSITIPNSVTSIGENAFFWCTSLKTIYLPASASIGTDAIPASATQIKYTVSGDNVTVTEVTLGSGQTSVTIPETIGGKAVTVVFTKDGTNISAPASATQIKYTVSGDNVTVTGVTLGSGQTSVTIPETIDGKTVTPVCIQDGATGIDVHASATQIKYTVDDSNNVTITGATLGEGVTSVTIPDTIDGKTVTSIGQYAFDGYSSLESITIPDSVTSIGNNAFNNCTSLTSITIPSSVNSIGINAFRSCTSLTSITIPSSVTSIGAYAFKNCTSLKTIYLPASASVGTDAIDETATQIKYTVTDDKVTIKNVTLGSGQTSVTIPDTIDGKTVTSIGNDAFNNCTSLTSITIPSSVNSIGINAFKECTSLASITIPNGVTSIGYSAFRSCTNLTSITIPDSVTSIGNYAFRSCESLTSITIPGSVTSIGEYAFRSCTSLTSIFLPERLTSIGTDAIPASATQIKYTVSGNEVTITEITLGTGQTSVAIPATIGGYSVVSVAEACQQYVGNHTHIFDSNNVCTICGSDKLENVSITITEPKAAESLAATASVSTTGVEAAPTITWQPNNTSADYNTVYTASVTLTASTNYMFADSVSVSVNGTAVDSSNISYNADGTITVTYAFPATAKDELISFIITGRILTDTGASIEGNMTGLANYKNKEEVTLNVPVITGYNFVGWYEYSESSANKYTGENLCTSRTYKFTAEADRNLVAVYKPIASAELTIDGGNSFTINGDNRTTAVPEPYLLGSQITVVCNDNDFEYWKNSAGMVVSRDKSYTFTVTGRETISAVFNTIAENKATVVFESYYGQVIARDQYVAGATLTETPGLPFRYGYTALGWDYNGDGMYDTSDVTEDTFAKALERGFASEHKLVKILPVYQLNETTYQITVENGTGAGTYKQNDVVTVVANAASGGNKFSHWADGAGNILSYNEKYQFYAAKNITVIAVYVKDTVKVEAKGTTEIVDKFADKANGKLTFVSMSTVPEGCTINKAGIIATNDQTVAESGDGFNAGTAAYVRGNSWTGNAYRYTWTKSKVGSGETWYVRAYLVYTDAEGNVNTVYGDKVSQTMQ